jgi:hypothetical protein
MVSQPPMQRILGLPTYLLGLTAALLLFAACGQNEGGRCQVNSDCASGLKCNSTTGNGICVSQNTVPSNNDAAPDLSVMSGPEVGIDTEVTSTIDADTLDTGAVTLDTGAVDSGSLDSTGLD